MARNGRHGNHIRAFIGTLSRRGGPAVIEAELAAQVRRVLEAATEATPLLVGLDFDGVLAPIVADRDAARALPGALDAVQALAERPDVVVAVVSGRALADLSTVSGLAPGAAITLVGSHGAESSLRHAGGELLATSRMTREATALLDRVTRGLEEIASAGPGLDVEHKPTGAVLHTRRATPEDAGTAAARALAGPASWTGVHATMGKSVVELSVVEVSKGVALQRLREIEGASAVLYVGDDVTDETAFAVLADGDVGVKVGEGDTHATYRVDGPEDVLELLYLLGG